MSDCLKTCTRCKVEKPFVEFGKNRRQKDGYHYWCKSCSKEYRRNYSDYAEVRKENRLARIESEPGYHERLLSATREWDRTHPERRLEIGRKYYRTHTYALSLKANLRRARILQAGREMISKDDWTKILETFEYRCAYCLQPENTLKASKLTLDHFRPLAKGGTHTKDNVIPACLSCNSSKRDDLIFSWLPRFESQGKFRTTKCR